MLANPHFRVTRAPRLLWAQVTGGRSVEYKDQVPGQLTVTQEH